MVLQEGTPAPTVEAPNQYGTKCTPSFQEPTVLYFYPRDGTPGCTTEADQFDGIYDSLDGAGVELYGVSTDGVDSHREFAAERDIDFDLLADPEGEIADDFGVELGFGDAVSRTTFILEAGQVREVYENVNPDGHAAEVRERLREMGALGSGS